jgi:hypothetical protein
MNKSYVKSFYAVTMSSIFSVIDKNEDGMPCVEMIASNGTGKMAVGQRLKGGDLVVIFYVISITTAQTYEFFQKTCDPNYGEDRVRIKYLGGHTGNIVALFEAEAEAQRCYLAANLQPVDLRWIAQTRQVLTNIGPDHPCFKIATEDYRLIRD